MDSLITFAQQVSPLTFSLLVIGGLVHIVILLLKQFGVMKSVRDTQKTKYPLIEKAESEIQDLSQKLGILLSGQEKIIENHFNHEVPEINSSLNRIENKSDKMIELLTQINTKIK